MAEKINVKEIVNKTRCGWFREINESPDDIAEWIWKSIVASLQGKAITDVISPEDGMAEVTLTINGQELSFTAVIERWATTIKQQLPQKAADMIKAQIECQTLHIYDALAKMDEAIRDRLKEVLPEIDFDD